MTNEFQKVYLKIIEEQNIIKEGFWGNLAAAAKQKISSNPTDLYFDSGKGAANDLWYTVIKFQQLCNKLGFKDIPKDPFRELTKYFKTQKGFSKKGVQAASQTAGEKVAKDVVEADKAVTQAVYKFKDDIQNSVKAVYQKATGSVLYIIDVIIAAFKYSKDKVIAAFKDAVTKVKNLSKQAVAKVTALIDELAKIRASIIKFELDVIMSIAKILGKIALVSVGIIVIAAQNIAQNITDFFDVAITKGKQVTNAGKAAFVATEKQISIMIKTVGKLKQKIGEARAEAKSQIEANATA